MKAVLQLLILLVSSLSACVASADALLPPATHPGIALHMTGGNHDVHPPTPYGAPPVHPPPSRRQDIRPQGDLRGDIYRHMQEQHHRAPRSAPASGALRRERARQ